MLRTFERVAVVVTDESWIKPALRALSLLMPGPARGFAVTTFPARTRASSMRTPP
jgi:hypothetical protein